MPSCIKKRLKIIIGSFLIVCFLQLNVAAQQINLLPELDQAGGLYSNAVRCMQIDAQGRVWTGTDNGLNILNANTPAQQKIAAVLTNKSIWGIGFYDSLAFVGSRYDGLYIFNVNTGNIYKHFPPTVINQIRKVKILNNKVFILSNEGVFEWRNNSLTKLSFTKNIKNDFATDLFYWKNELYALSYIGFNVIKYGIDGFEEICTDSFIKVNDRRSIMCANVQGNTLVIGGDGYYMVQKNYSIPKIYYLPKANGEAYVVWDIAFTNDNILLAIGDRISNEKGFLHFAEAPFLNGQLNNTGYLTAMVYDNKKNDLFYGDLNNGLFLQKSISSTSSIEKTNASKIIANRKYSFLYDENSVKKINEPSQFIKNISAGRITTAKLFGDTLVVVLNKFICFYDPGNLRLFKKVSAGAYKTDGINNIELLGNRLYLFSTYSEGIYYLDLSKNSTELNLNLNTSLPIIEKKDDKVIFLNREKGFNVIEKDTAYSLMATDKSTAFLSSFLLLGDSIYALNKMTLKSFKINYKQKNIITGNSINLENLIEGFTAKWVYSNKENIFLVNEKGILKIDPTTGFPQGYEYTGNNPLIDKPILVNDSLWYSTSSFLTKFPLDNFSLKSPINPSEILLKYPASVNENLAFKIIVSYPDYQVQKYGLKCIEIKKNGKSVYKKYTINDQFNFAAGLTYGDYDMLVTIGDSTIKRELNISLPLNRNPYFFGFIVFFIIALLGLWIKNFLDKRSLNKKLMQNRLQLLKQNLNPHFVFNSMNLISSLILEKKYDKAVEVVADFSNLQRVYLETNNKEAITLSEEISFLEAYLKLQQTRFHYDNDFTYSITIADKIDAKTILLPPLILQPLAENAIKYGVVGSSAKQKNININVYGINPLIIAIEDNGKDVNATYKGIGLGHKLVEERIALFNATHKKNNVSVIFGVEMESEGYRVEVRVGN